MYTKAEMSRFNNELDLCVTPTVLAWFKFDSFFSCLHFIFVLIIIVIKILLEALVSSSFRRQHRALAVNQKGRIIIPMGLRLTLASLSTVQCRQQRWNSW